MFPKRLGKVHSLRKSTNLIRSIGAAKDKICENDRSNGEDADELKRRLLPTLIAKYEQKGRVTVWRMPTEISQSRLAGRYRPSNACTIIVVKLAEFIYRDGIILKPTEVVNPNKRNNIASRMRFKNWPTKLFADSAEIECVTHCSGQLLNAFINAIIEGNEIHEQQMARRYPFLKSTLNGPHPETFTIPQALEGCGNVFYEIDYAAVRGNLIENMKAFVPMPIESEILKDHLQIYIVLIVFERSVLLVYERDCNTVYLLDTHTHQKAKNMKTGGLIAMCSLINLEYLLKWMCKNVFPEVASKSDFDQSFEISVIAFKGQLLTDDHPQFIPQTVQNQQLFPKRWNQLFRITQSQPPEKVTN